MMEFVNEKMSPGGAGSDFKNLLKDYFNMAVNVAGAMSCRESFLRSGLADDEDPLHRKLLALQIN